jgi:hypothetical protein
MMKLIGARRVFILLAFFALNALIVSSYFLALQPLQSEAATQLTAVKGQVSELQGKIRNIKQDLIDYKDNEPKYQKLKAQGFFQTQDRFQISKILEAMRQSHNLQGFSFSIDNINYINNADADAIQHRLIHSQVSLKKVQSSFDNNVYDFAQSLAEAFPTHTHLQKIEVLQTTAINEPNLQRVAGGEKVGFVEANIVFDWLTLVPKPEQAPVVDAAGAVPAGGFRGR